MFKSKLNLLKNHRKLFISGIEPRKINFQFKKEIFLFKKVKIAPLYSIYCWNHEKEFNHESSLTFW